MGIDWVGYGIWIVVPLGAILFFFYQQFLFELVSSHFELEKYWGVLAVATSVGIHYIAIVRIVQPSRRPASRTPTAGARIRSA
eukprot:SAG22_NODE_1453_length_4394_cov_29.832363_2_plen_83_part_00